MSSTNKTSNYDLSQFVSTDKPAWLTDYNQDMTKIDSGINTAQNTATGADGKADSNTTKIGQLENLTTTAKTNLVNAINEVDSIASTAQETASAGTTIANQALTKASQIDKFNLTKQIVLSPSVNRGSINTNVSYVHYAGDSSDSIFKTYGRVYISSLSGISGSLTVTLGQTPLRPSSAYEITAGGICSTRNSNLTISDQFAVSLHVALDGKITLSTIPLDGNIADASIVIPPCLYFNEDFGDVS